MNALRTLAWALVCGLLSIPAFAQLTAIAPGALAVTGCPKDAVFLALQDQVRGYSLRANGATRPCQVLQGPATTLSTAGAIAFSRNGFFHIAQFLTDATVNIFPPQASHDAAPSRSFMLPENDLVSIAVDSRINDFVMDIRQPAVPIFVVPNRSAGVVANPIVLSDPNLSQYLSLAVDSEDNLLVAGYNDRGAVVIDTFGTARSITAPALLRSLTGPRTRLLSGAQTFGSNGLTISVDPGTDELFVYNTSADLTQIKVSVFAARASGDVQPLREISGPATGITGPGVAGTSKISISSDGRLFVAEPNRRILVFAPGASGDVSPSQVIVDSTDGPADQGGIAVRSSRCR